MSKIDGFFFSPKSNFWNLSITINLDNRLSLNDSLFDDQGLVFVCNLLVGSVYLSKFISLAIHLSE